MPGQFFWSGQHWLKAGVLYLPLQEGGQGLIDLASRVAAFRLQAAQRLLYHEDVCWREPACSLLRRIGGMGLDRHWFLMEPGNLCSEGCTDFYKSVLRAWRGLRISREWGMVPIQWVQEEPLFHNQLIPTPAAFSNSLNKLGHLWGPVGWRTARSVAEQIGAHSERAMQTILDGIRGVLPVLVWANLENRKAAEQGSVKLAFPGLRVAAEVGEWQEEEGNLLSFKSPMMGDFVAVGRKPLYAICVKIRHLNELKQVKNSKWQDLLGAGGLARGAWRVFYKQPLPKRSGDLQWRIVHGAIASNTHLAHLDPGRSRECPFCSVNETTAHVFLQCARLADLFLVLREVCDRLGLVFSPKVFVFGPGYSYSQRWKCCLANFVFGQAKLAIWLTRRNMIRSNGPVCAKLLFKKIVLSRLRVEYAHAEIKMTLRGLKEYGQWAGR